MVAIAGRSVTAPVRFWRETLPVVATLSPMSILGRLKHLRPVQKLRRARHRRYFESAAGQALHDGVFRTFAEAAATEPGAKGFNEPMHASEYADRLGRVFPYDYPVLFWLQQMFAGATALDLVDIGGNIGLHYYAYGNLLRFPPRLTWRVIEVEAVVKAGRERAERLGAQGLEFATSLEALEPADIVISAGALHYIEQPLLWDVIERAHTKPAHVLLNKLPLYEGEDFVSLQNIGDGFSPHYVWNRKDFVRRFERLGYHLADDWSVLERHFELFDDPVHSFGAYSGLYLRRDRP